MGISKVTQICENNKKSPCGSCSLFGSQSMFVGGMLPARRLPATPPWHLCQDHRHLGTTPSFLHLNLKPAAWQGQRPLVPCWASLARTTSKKRSCCITDAVSCCTLFFLWHLPPEHCTSPLLVSGQGRSNLSYSGSYS